MASRRTVLFRGGHILRDDWPPLERANVLIEEGRVTAIAAKLTPPDGAETLDASDCLVIPELVNIHTHGVDILFQGLGDRWTLEDRLNHGPALSLRHTTEDQSVSMATRGRDRPMPLPNCQALAMAAFPVDRCAPPPEETGAG
jgi:cytosine/adenosine deaminase-related metal-dependent hydrolase